MALKKIYFVYAAVVGLVFALSGCGEDSAAQACSTDDDCALGAVCSFENVCISVSCDNCSDSQVCYKPTPDSAGTCSKPECLTSADCNGQTCNAGLCGSSAGCTNDSDCASGEECNLAGACVPKEGEGGCEDHVDCANGEFCNTEGTCETGCRANDECPLGQVCGNGDCACGPTTCPEGKVCLDTGNCGDPTDCSQVVCDQTTQVCDPTTFGCIDRCTDEDCNANEICNANTGLCEVSNCPTEDPAQCDGNAQRPIWDPIRCFCAECTSDSDCDMAAGETCNANGSCFSCETSCNPNAPTACSNDKPYCINDCCIECVAAADCAPGQLCLDGECGQPPNCTADPTVCPAGTVCQNGSCVPPVGSACDPADPMSCPAGEFCGPDMTCQGLFPGGGGCGLCPGTDDGAGGCNDACPGTCEDYFLVKACSCDLLGGVGCPGDAVCIPLLDVCI